MKNLNTQETQATMGEITQQPRKEWAREDELKEIWAKCKTLGLCKGSPKYMQLSENLFYNLTTGAIGNQGVVNPASVQANQTGNKGYDLDAKHIDMIINALEKKLEVAKLESDLMYEMMLRDLDEKRLNDIFVEPHFEFFKNKNARALFNLTSDGVIVTNNRIVDLLVSVNMERSMGAESPSFGQTTMHSLNPDLNPSPAQLRKLVLPADFNRAVKVLKNVMSANSWDVLTELLETDLAPYMYQTVTSNVAYNTPVSNNRW